MGDGSCVDPVTDANFHLKCALDTHQNDETIKELFRDFGRAVLLSNSTCRNLAEKVRQFAVSVDPEQAISAPSGRNESVVPHQRSWMSVSAHAEAKVWPVSFRYDPDRLLVWCW